MKFCLFNYPSVPASFEERERLRPIGRNSDKYQEMLHEMREYVVLADELGFDAFSTTEHHLHSEGMELSAGCLLLYADLAARTKRIKFAPMAVVLPSNNPIRVATEMAVLDQLTQGRVCAGFARGYQDRWMNIFGQHAGVQGAPMDGSDVDIRNREVFDEYRDIIYKAWTEDLLQYNGKYFQVPFPYDEGITRWPAAPFTAKYGTPGEVDEDGVVRGVSVCPRPYQDPCPEVAFQPFSVSESTIKATARNGSIPLILTCWPENFRALCETYRDIAAEAGRDLKLGESVGAMRPVAFGDTTQEAIDRMERNNMRAFKEYFGPFGYFEVCRYPEDAEKFPGPLPDEEQNIQRYIGTKFGIAGTPDEVKRDFEALHKIHGDGELEWFVWFFDQGHMPLDEGKRQMELFAEHIIPEFSDTYATAAA